MSLNTIRLAIFFFCASLPFGTHYYIHPIVKQDIIQDMERESIHLARHITTELNLASTPVSAEIRMTPQTRQTIQQALDNFEAEKLRLFSPNGVIIFSTDPADIGLVHTSGQFSAIVQTGAPYSKKVVKNHTTLDGTVSDKTVIETYIPVIARDADGTKRILAVQEIYFDITDRWGTINGLLNKSLAVVVLVSLLFVTSSHFLIKRLEKNERHLFQANQDLEKKNRQILEASRRRQQAEAFLQNIIDQIDDHVLVIDTDYRITWMNRAARRVYGETPEKGACYQITHQASTPCDGTDHPCPLLMAKKKGKPVSIMHIHTNRAGEKKHIEIHASPITDEQGTFAGIIQFSRDKTAIVNQEKEEAKRQHLQSLGFIAAGIAHDFNNLLMAILGNINLAKHLIDHKPVDDDEVKHSLREAASSSKQAAILTKKLLTFAKGGAPWITPLDLQKYMGESGLVPLQKFADISCDVSYADDLWHAAADSAQLDQVIHNLLVNSVEAMEFKGKITVRLENITVTEEETTGLSPGDYIAISIADTGKGIQPEHLEHIFDPYFTTKEMNAVKGTGLGLAISYSIIQRHKGTITVFSEPGFGAVFTVFLPRATQTLPAEEA